MLRRYVFFSISSTLFALSNAQSRTDWPGWNAISNIFNFGDSYTTTGFMINGTQPNVDNIFGNPAFPGPTFSNGRNWIDFLTHSYNDSIAFNYNFAVAGATVDSLGLPSRFRRMDQQVRNFFLPNYASNVTNAKAKWSSNNTLFTSFFGINDINASFKMGRTNMTALHAQNFLTYTQLVDELYRAGARIFLFMNVPAVHRSPLILRQGNASVALSRAAIYDFNSRISNMVQSFTSRRTDTTVFMLDTFDLFNKVLDDPKSRPETEYYTNTTGFCPAYFARTYNEESFNVASRKTEYFWLDVLHPTPPVHEAIAADIASLLRNSNFIISSNTTPPNTTSPTNPTPSPALENHSSPRLPPSLASAILPLAAWLALL